MRANGLRAILVALLTTVLMLPSDYGLAQQSTKTGAGSAAAAGQIADILSNVGDQMYEDCIFELSQEQIEVQYTLIQAYIQQGAAVLMQGGSPQHKSSRPNCQKCEQIRRSPRSPSLKLGHSLAVPKKPTIEAALRLPPEQPAPVIALTGKKALPQWDCAPGVDYVTIHLNGYERES